MENFKIAPSNKTEYDSKGIAPSFESHFKEPKRNFKIASSLEMLQQVLTSGFTNLEVFPNRKFKIASSLAMIKQV